MEQTKAVRAEAGDVLVVHEVLTLQAQVVLGCPVAADGQNVVGRGQHRHDVRQADACLHAVLVLVLKAGEVQVNLNLQELVAVVVHRAEAGLFVLGLADVVDVARGLAQVHLTVEPGVHQLENLVLGLTHHVGDAVASEDVRHAVRQDHVLGGHKHRCLATQAWVVVDLLERRTRGRQAPEHALMLRAELNHDLGQLVVHVLGNAAGGFLLLRCLLANNFCHHRAFGRECLHDGF